MVIVNNAHKIVPNVKISQKIAQFVLAIIEKQLLVVVAQQVITRTKLITSAKNVLKTVILVTMKIPVRFALGKTEMYKINVYA